MAVRLAVAIVLGGLMGLERELVHKEAGIRTSMMVAGGAAIFTMIGLELPYLIAPSPAAVSAIIAGNGGFLNLIANIVVGIGFLGAGIIIKTEGHVHGLTTAAVVWVTGAIGVLCGIGLLSFAATAVIALAVLLYLLRKIDLTKTKADGR